MQAINLVVQNEFIIISLILDKITINLFHDQTAVNREMGGKKGNNSIA